MQWNFVVTFIVAVTHSLELEGELTGWKSSNFMTIPSFSIAVTKLPKLINNIVLKILVLHENIKIVPCY